jgi:ferredoxin-type protein NapH
MSEIVADMLTLTLAVGLTLAGVLVILIRKKDLTRKVSYLRLFIQVASLVGFFYLFTLVLWLSVFFLVIFVATLFSGRFFCGWICPFGLYMDLIAMLRKKIGIRYRNLPEKINTDLHKLRYIIAAIILVSPFFLGALDFAPQSGIYALFLRGPFRSLGMLLSPLEPLIVPWTGTAGASIIAPAGFNNWGISYPYAREIMAVLNEPTTALILVYIFIVLTLASTFLVRRFWCRFCPSAISIGAINRLKVFRGLPLLHINKVEEKCTKCGICKRVCPVQVTEVYEKKGGDINTSMCMNCMRCVEMCPYEGCLKVNLAGKPVFKSRNWLEPAKTE